MSLFQIVLVLLTLFGPSQNHSSQCALESFDLLNITLQNLNNASEYSNTIHGVNKGDIAHHIFAISEVEVETEEEDFGILNKVHFSFLNIDRSSLDQLFFELYFQYKFYLSPNQDLERAILFQVFRC